MTNEYPPNIYGGAGVHVGYLSRALARSARVEVRCFGDQAYKSGQLIVKGYKPWGEMTGKHSPKFEKVIKALSVDLAMASDYIDSQVVHCHTWYTFFVGFLAKKLYNVPLITTVHSLEPLRTWKREQLGSAYQVSSWMEKVGIEASDMVIAVSRSMKEDVLACYQVSEERITVIHNGVDVDEYRPTVEDNALKEYGIDKDYVLFVGRISKQKGIFHLLDAIDELPRGIQIVLCASTPDTKDLEAELERRVQGRRGVVWINRMLEKEKVIQLYSHARVFVCPSVYEPFGIINLEAMACGAPVVASAVGGIKEVVVHGETGMLVEPGNPKALAWAITRVLTDDELRSKLKINGKKWVKENFSWEAIARHTLAVYEKVLMIG